MVAIPAPSVTPMVERRNPGRPVREIHTTQRNRRLGEIEKVAAAPEKYAVLGEIYTAKGITEKYPSQGIRKKPQRQGERCGFGRHSLRVTRGGEDHGSANDWFVVDSRGVSKRKVTCHVEVDKVLRVR